MYDYFIAASDEAAAAVIDLPGGPSGALPPLPMPVPDLVARYGVEGLRRFFAPAVRLSEHGIPTLSTKGFDPAADLNEIYASLTGVRFDDAISRLDDSVLAMRYEGEEVVLAIDGSVRDALAAATSARLRAAAAAWLEEQAPYRHVDVEAISDLLEQLSELARMATARGEGMYCWACV